MKKSQIKQWRKITLADRLWHNLTEIIILYALGGAVLWLGGKSWGKILTVIGVVFIFTIIIAFAMELFISEAPCSCGQRVNLNEGVCKNCGEKAPPYMY